jgi:hypothetical protein
MLALTGGGRGGAHRVSQILKQQKKTWCSSLSLFDVSTHHDVSQIFRGDFPASLHLAYLLHINRYRSENHVIG